MGVTRLLNNPTMWSEIKPHARDGKRVQTAVAYFGTGGADLLPLKRQSRNSLVCLALGPNRGPTDGQEPE